jgi:hypothetical protein
MNTREHLEKLSAERCTDWEIHNTMNLSDVFDGSYEVQAKNLYLTRFGRIPNQIRLCRDIDIQKADKWFRQTYQDCITDYFYTKKHSSNREKTKNYEYVCYFLFDDLLVYLNGWIYTFLFRKTDVALVEKVANGMAKFKRRNNRPRIQLLVTESGGLSTRTMNISKPKLSLEDNYNNDFLPIHQTILERLKKKNDKGLVLLHGKPGTGKTSYIRYLITQCKKPVIFLPPNMAASITDPGLMNLLVENPNSIFVIEDAENIIIDRNNSGSSAVSALLNLADGLLSDCLNIQVICSFNTDISRVDSALTRKGRLIAKYEFSELAVSKAQVLSEKLGFSSVIAAPMTLAAIYNQTEREFSATIGRKKIGFSIAS